MLQLTSFVLCGAPPGPHNSSLSSCDVLYPSTSMDETFIAGPSQDLSSFLAFLRMPLTEGEVEGGVGIVYCGLAHTALGLIGLPQLCIIGLLNLLMMVAAPMVVVHLPVDVVSRVSLTMLAMRDLSSSPAVFSSSLAFFCSLISSQLQQPWPC